jgi:hypothetical protein
MVSVRTEPGPLPAAAQGKVWHVARDFSNFKPVSDNVFEAYKASMRIRICR